MQQTAPNVLLTAQSANGSGAVIPMKRCEDTFVLFPVTAGGTVAMTLNIEMLSPDGVSWCQVATRALSTVGVQPVIPLNYLPGQAIRATVAGWTNGTVSVQGYMAASMRD